MAVAVEDSTRKYVNFRLSSIPPGDRPKKHGDLLKALTIGLVETYARCNTSFGYTLSLAPRRVLTKLSKGVHNSDYDNAEHDYICRVGDKIVNPDNQSYEILERLGHGTFGQVLKCQSMPTAPDGSPGQPVALKIIKNKPAYFHQALVEVRILQMLNSEFDPKDEHRLVRMLDFFVYRKHLCIVFELLSVNLYDVLKQNSFRGVSMALIRVLTEQLLKAMRCLREASVIHCDLKPENVLLSDMQHTRIKLIDFGSACIDNHTVYSYIQSRFYRSPEVLLGLPYTSAIDMWSLGCICAELFLGLPIFPGHSEFDQVCRIVEVLRNPPQPMLEAGRTTRRYFRRVEEVDQDPAGASALSSGGSPEGLGDGPAVCLEDGSAVAAAAAANDRGATSPKSPTVLPPASAPPAAGPGQGAAAPPQPPPLGPVARTAWAPGGARVTAGRQRGAGQEGESGSELEAASAGEAVCSGEVGQGVSPDDGSGPSKDSLRRSGSLLNLFMSKVGLGYEEPAPDTTATASAGVQTGAAPAAPPAHPPAAACSGPGLAAAGKAPDACRSAGSAMSTAVETPDAVWRHRAVSSSDDAGLRDGSTDGIDHSRATANASTGGSSDCSARPPAAQHSWHGGASTQPLPCARAVGVVVDDGQMPEGRAVEGEAVGQRARRRGRRRTIWRLKTVDEYEREEHKKEPVRKTYFNFKSLEEMVQLVPYKPNLSKKNKMEEQERRLLFLHFITGVLELNPNIRWTPLQASTHPFITGGALDADWAPEPDPHPVPAFTEAPMPGRVAGALSGPGEVPRLPADGPFGAGASTSGFVGGGSARTYNENVSRQGGGGGAEGERGPASAPATARCQGPTPRGAALRSYAAPQAGSGAGAGTAGGSGAPAKEAEPAKTADSAAPAAAPAGLWGHLCLGVPLPEDNPNESYRPPIDKMSEEFLRNVLQARHRRSQQPPPFAPHKGRAGGYSVSGSAGASFCSSASSAGSTPTGARGRRGAVGSPFSGPRQLPHGVFTGGDSKHTGRAGGSSHHLSGTTATPASSPHASSSAGGGHPWSGGPAGQHHRHHHSVTLRGRGEGSRDGSRVSSPWHLPSPMSELSTASDRINSSQPSGSDSCGENAAANFEGHHACEGWESLEDPSQSDGVSHSAWPRSTQSDSDCATPRSHDAPPVEDRAKDAQQRGWENIPQFSRIQLSRGRLQDAAQSAGGMVTIGNFREKVGMNEGGPVTPCRRDAINSMIQRESGTEGADSGGPRHGVRRSHT